MKKINFLFLGFSAFVLVGFISCTPGERPRGSSSSETAMEDTIAAEYKSGKPDDSTNTKKDPKADTSVSGD